MYVQAVRSGVKPTEYWDMTLGEIVDSIEQFCYMRKQEIELQSNYADLICLYIGRAIHDIPLNMGVVLSPKGQKYPKLDEYMPESVRKMRAEKTDDRKEKATDAGLLAWAHRVNASRRAKDVQKLHEQVSGVKRSDTHGN